MSALQLFLSGNDIYSDFGCLDPWSWAWAVGDLPSDAKPITSVDALLTLNKSQTMRKFPVGVIGPREATDEQLSAAKEVGAALANLGLTMICGGKSGVMTAAAEGCLKAGGLSVGLIPDHEWRAANPFIALPIATGLSEARNMVIAKSSEVLIAIGGSYGTLSEVAYGLHFSKPVIGLCGAAQVDGVELVETPSDAIERVGSHLFNRVRMS
ncbi:TIGR00725 family protein [Roseibium aggregatum]|uniref:TIGR00725 family protein n=1 Tax=Roseibium aggregatum TaxID=187304 RepID=UPI0025ACC524|nr:TIGR00725 family protein [Roseibium aggregatum]WJS05704.1 TIGR00725 family protein [Roseibium aggregatum]